MGLVMTLALVQSVPPIGIAVQFRDKREAMACDGDLENTGPIDSSKDEPA